ncbi:deoxyribodipyrimidine photolyase [Flavobacteriaceae bacterium]|nr:deoxyribodipyrimidine photolyase [Flavobacteriaceae bacterium]
MELNYSKIIHKIESIDPVKYSQNRNFVDGSVTKLSPYISRGMISTKYVFEKILEKEIPFWKIEKFIQELCWRDYWQLIWKREGSRIDSDLKTTQVGVTNHSISKSIVDANCGIEAIDDSINKLYRTGYMHNHNRMYLASIACNVAKSHWLNPAKWMYFNLFDGDWGSNALSWQWVCGSNSNKKYYANQENINKYCYTVQRNTFLDTDYSKFESLTIPENLKETENLKLSTKLPENKILKIDKNNPTLIYNYYNLDPKWRQEKNYNRVFLLEPKTFEKYPVSSKCIDFAIELSKNIKGIQIYVGSFFDLVKQYDIKNTFYKEHPLNNYQGIEDSRDWIFESHENIKSFFSYWKKCKKELKIKNIIK